MNDGVVNALGCILYTRYGEATGFKNFQGNPMPRWEDLPEGVVKAWEHVAEKVYPGARTNTMTFGTAIEMMKNGFRICRKGWNGRNMYVYYVPAAEYPAQTPIARQEFGEMVPYNAYMAIKTAQGTVSTWAPSGSDALATDWMVVENE